MAADQGGQGGGIGVVGGQVGEGVSDFVAGALPVQSAGGADDPQDLVGAGEVEAGGRQHLDEAFLGSGVSRGSGLGWRSGAGR